MLKGLSLRELATKIEATKLTKRDYVADTRDLSYEAPEAGGLRLVVANQGTHAVRPNAHRQIGSYLQIPAPYYDRMLAERPHLLAQNVNTWMNGHKPERKLVRTTTDLGARAFLSDRYQRIENEAIAEVALPILAEIPGVTIVSSEVTEKRLYIQAVVPSMEAEVKKGDVVQAGLVISNSEVGHGAVSIASLVWRLICLNGMKTTDTFRRNHVGRRITEEDMQWSDETIRSDDQTILLKVRDTVRMAIDDQRFRASVAKLTDLAEVKVEGNPARAVELLAAKLETTEAEQGGILRALIEGGDLSAWGLMNAVTAQAHSAGSYDRAVEFEEAGGRLLELPRSEWREILQAA